MNFVIRFRRISRDVDIATLAIVRQFRIVGTADRADTRLRRQNFKQVFLQWQSLL